MNRSGQPLAMLALSFLAVSCGKKVPPDMGAIIDVHHATIVSVAEEAAKRCPGTKLAAPFQADPMAAPPAPANPAIGTPLEKDGTVVDVFVSCQWPDPRIPGGEGWGGTGLKSLKGTNHIPLLKVTMPEDLVLNTCPKDRHNCEQIVVPSRYSALTSSADIRVTRPTPDGGEAEVTVVIGK